jgi:hypothetical protein
MPAETLARLEDLGVSVRFIHGNGERIVLAGAADQIRATQYPLVEELLVRYVLNPPTEAETLELFARAELR